MIFEVVVGYYDKSRDIGGGPTQRIGCYDQACAYYARKFTYYFFENFPNFSPIILLCLAYYSQVIFRRYTGIRSTSFKIAESNEVKSLVLTANCKQGTI